MIVSIIIGTCLMIIYNLIKNLSFVQFFSWPLASCSDELVTVSLMYYIEGLFFGRALPHFSDITIPKLILCTTILSEGEGEFLSKISFNLDGELYQGSIHSAAVKSAQVPPPPPPPPPPFSLPGLFCLFNVINF